ncbi:CoA-binding protein [Clostridium chauvoei]|uniref:CoA-binding domain-containing protein n=2 Tax=Clostridium chauvoei TaxID=46867 RepID=S6FK87_9CLOT|nr:CoA-binding protein [Clostridium chauvoei]ATD54437.1 CoA-binding protein [Clostridium chauvoei]ATD57879.1 CoA-binding protein [Clostridium chauvoei]MBX7279667.1 CoA-binding protein [Clostridium chauvoei]MBX7282036.1 CoA-binding protein [Clostridium chauvoei]MBX7284558.1 CoA-binding protein [Clostridium chauvoei]
MNIKEMIQLKNWVVVGDVTNTSKYAYKILEKFKSKSYVVSGVHPKGGENVFKTLTEVPYKIDAIDLCVNPKLGLEILKEANSLGIKNVLIQPGAESDEILLYCRENGIASIENCALVQL